MYPRSVIDDQQWQEAFNQWEQGKIIRHLARHLHVDERRVMSTFKAIDAIRYARVKSAKARHGSQAPSQRPRGRPWHKAPAIDDQPWRGVIDAWEHGLVRSWAMMTPAQREVIQQRFMNRQQEG